MHVTSRTTAPTKASAPGAATPTAALYEAAARRRTRVRRRMVQLASRLLRHAGGPTTSPGGAPNFESWGYAVNYTTANVGGCQFALAPGNEVLWAYNYFNLPHLLEPLGSRAARTPARRSPSTSSTAARANRSPERRSAKTSAASRRRSRALPGQTPRATQQSHSPTRGHVAAQGDARRIGALQRACGVRPQRQRRNLRHGDVPSGGAQPARRDGPAPAHVAVRDSPAACSNGHVYARRQAPRMLRGLVQRARGRDAARGAHQPAASQRRALLRLQRRREASCGPAAAPRGSSRSAAPSRSATCCPAPLRPAATSTTSQAIDGVGTSRPGSSAESVMSCSVSARQALAGAVRTSVALGLHGRGARARRRASAGLAWSRGRLARPSVQSMIVGIGGRVLARPVGRRGGGEQPARARPRLRGRRRHAAGRARRRPRRGRAGLRAARLRALRRLGRQLRTAVRVLARRREQSRTERLGVQGRRRLRHDRRRRPERPDGQTGGGCAPAIRCCGSGAKRSRAAASARSSCLAATATVSRDASLTVTVYGADNEGRLAYSRARSSRSAPRFATTGTHGHATLTAPCRAGSLRDLPRRGAGWCPRSRGRSWCGEGARRQPRAARCSAPLSAGGLRPRARGPRPRPCSCSSAATSARARWAAQAPRGSAGRRP